MAARMIPMNTVQPISVPWISIAQKMAGWKKRGNGRKSSFQNDSSVLRPVKMAKECREKMLVEAGGEAASSGACSLRELSGGEDFVSPLEGSLYWVRVSVLKDASRR